MLTRRATLALLPATVFAASGALAETDFAFLSVDGGVLSLADYRGQPLLVVNTASLCGFTHQYDALQRLHEAYAGRATVLAVPSDDFGGQELLTSAEVREFCAVNYDLTLPMADITRVRGAEAHPFYRWAAQQGVTPRWNFHKILLDARGQLVADFPSQVSPDSPALTGALDELLPQG